MTSEAGHVNPGAYGAARHTPKHVETKLISTSGFSPYRFVVQMFEQIGIDQVKYPLRGLSGGKADIALRESVDAVPEIVLSALLPAIKGGAPTGHRTAGWKAWTNALKTEDDEMYAEDYGGEPEYLRQAKSAYYFEAEEFHNDTPFVVEGDSVVQRPDAVVNPSDAKHWAAWCNAVGYAIWHQADIVATHVVLNRINAVAMYLWDELNGDPDKLCKMDTGNFGNGEEHLDELIRFAMEPRRVWVRTPLVENESPLMIVACYHLELKIVVTFAKLQDLVIMNDGTVPYALKTGSVLTMDDIEFDVIITQVYLSEHQREKAMQTKEFNVLVRQFQQNQHSITSGDSELKLKEAGLTRLLVFAFRRAAAESQNEWFNLDGVGGGHMLDRAQMKLGNLVFEQEKEAALMHALSSASFCRRRLRDEVKAYVIPVDPQCGETQPGNVVNLSRYRDNVIEYKLAEGAPLPATGITMSMGPNLHNYTKGTVRGYYMLFSAS